MITLTKIDEGYCRCSHLYERKETGIKWLNTKKVAMLFYFDEKTEPLEDLETAKKHLETNKDINLITFEIMLWGKRTPTDEKYAIIQEVIDFMPDNVFAIKFEFVGITYLGIDTNETKKKLTEGKKFPIVIPDKIKELYIYAPCLHDIIFSEGGKGCWTSYFSEFFDKLPLSLIVLALQMSFRDITLPDCEPYVPTLSNLPPGLKILYLNTSQEENSLVVDWLEKKVIVPPSLEAIVKSRPLGFDVKWLI